MNGTRAWDEADRRAAESKGLTWHECWDENGVYYSASITGCGIGMELMVYNDGSRRLKCPNYNSSATGDTFEHAWGIIMHDMKCILKHDIRAAHATARALGMKLG